MMIQGKSCTLTVAKDGYYYPLPYSEETVRLASKGYALPGVIGMRNREKRITTERNVKGCFVTRLEYQNLPPLFLLLFNSAESFDLLADRVCEKIIYKNIAPKAFELRGDNSKPFYLHIDVKETEESYTTGWEVNTPSLKWINGRTYNYNGHCVIADHKTLPLVYRFEIKGEFKTFLVYYLF